MGPLQLDALPTEVKQRIITIGSCENALKIRHVSKSWKEITSDPLMYKAMIESNTDGWSTIPLALDAPWSSWARYALADARASDLATWIDDNEKTRNLDSQPPASLTLPKGVNKMIYDWVPQLVTSQHPNLYKILKALDSPSIYVDWLDDARSLTMLHRAHTVAFCYTMKVLSHTPDNGPYHAGEPPSFLSRVLRVKEDIHEILKRPLHVTADDDIISWAFNTFERTRAMAAVALLCTRLRNSLDHFGRNRALVGDRVKKGLPTAKRIQFNHLLALPLPFSPNTSLELTDCQAAKMATSEFFEDDEWVGSCCLSIGCSGGIPSAWRLRFRAIPDGEDSTKLKLQATARSRDGDLLISILPLGNCQYQATMSDSATSFESKFCLFLLPCGFVGTTTDVDATVVWLWLWKAVWAEK